MIVDPDLMRLARHLGEHLIGFLPAGVTCRSSDTNLIVSCGAPRHSSRPATVSEIDLAAYRSPPDASPSNLSRIAGVGTRALDELQDVVSIQTHEAWPRIDGSMGTPAVAMWDDAVVLGYGVDRRGPPAPAWSLPPLTVRADRDGNP